MKNQTKIAAAKNKQNAHTPTTDKGQKQQKSLAFRDAAYGNRERGRTEESRGKGARQGRCYVLCAIQICTSNFYRTAQQRGEEAVINMNSWQGKGQKWQPGERRWSSQQKHELGE